MHFEFRETLRESGHSARYLRTFHEFNHQRIGLVSEIGEVPIAAILYLQIDGVRGTVSRNLRHLERQHLCIFNRHTVKVETIHDIVDIMFVTLTVVPVFQTNNKRSVTRSVGRDKAVTATYRITLHLRNGLHFLLYLLHDLGVLMKRGAFRHTDFT